MTPAKTVLFPRPNPGAELRLFAFPPAGYGASFYYLWANLLPDWVELCSVQLPGRESRLREKPLDQMSALTGLLARDLADAFDRPFVFFGHSMGAWVALELAHQILGCAYPLRALFLSGRRPPHLPDPLFPIHVLPDQAFTAELQRRYGSIPQVILQDSDLMAVFLPTLRADITLLDNFSTASVDPLEIPVQVFGGLDDPTLSRAELSAWRGYTRAEFSCHTFPGAHFYLQEQRDSFVSFLVSQLRNLVFGES